MYVPIRLANHPHPPHSIFEEPDHMASDSSANFFKKRKRTLEKLDLQRYLTTQSGLCNA